jgi:hypothetical protein
MPSSRPSARSARLLRMSIGGSGGSAALQILVASSSRVAAQTMPPAYEQHITAIKVCGARYRPAG